MPTADAFAELLAHPGVRERVALRSRFGFLAIHGGSLERGTAEIATRAAELSGASAYTVEQPRDLRWHLPSHLVDPARSPALREFLGHVELVVSVHGYGRRGWWRRLLLGGANRHLARRAGRRLREALPGYEVVDDLEMIPAELRGLHTRNPVNRPRRGGVQLELPPRVRGLVQVRPGDVTAPRADAECLVAALAGLARE